MDSNVRNQSTNDVHSPEAKSYAEILRGNPAINQEKARVSAKVDLKEIPITDVQLPLKQRQIKDGFPAIHLTSLKMQRSETLFQYTLIAKFSRGRPTMEVIRNHIAAH